MLRVTLNSIATGGLLSLGGAAVSAKAHAEKASEQAAALSAKVSAAAAAEKETGGRAVKLDIEGENGEWQGHEGFGGKARAGRAEIGSHRKPG